ncbi:extracellular solute-binding protein family 1 [Beutenbergia cavernae DSM 12333]|uniref:Extracellular solute-binding protein family 1 n=1 Tax=Beutenbergia cavernae (strain ATCC BAA-8 / DSM 12333 / CCUG 43141 / JCM 11478 / NBRC 16432 / NCIMB 13614 / HKI 0122) TaxID=471853 RepID=C5BZI3_BEUC1|nr:ABC transporter substrate-binding protein [Beutenbergia cavernae]ACQ79155.1 extracellular solute-binding protein family 1 [Beutenbergia cavernae DSM 12333]
MPSPTSRRPSGLWTPSRGARATWTPSRRDVLRIGGVGAAGGLVAACGGPSVGGDDGTATSDATDWSSVEPASKITWWSNHPGNTKELEESFIAAFNEEHPDIEVELVTAGANYDEIAQRFQAAAGTDEIPDLVGASDVWWFRYFVNGQIIPVDDVFEFLEVDTSDFVETLYSDYEYEGLHYAAPYARSTPLFYYNKDVWAAAGLPDRGPETWEELQEWGPAIRAHIPADGAPLGLSIGPSWSGWWYSNISWGLGAQMSDEWTVTLDSEESLAAGNFVAEMYHGENAFAGFGTDTNADFQAGIFASLIGSTGSLTGHLELAQFELGTAYLPDGPVAGPNVPTGGTGVAIAKDRTPEQQLAAAMFLAFLSDTDRTAEFSSATGYMPVRTSAIDGDVMGALYEETPQFRTSVDQLQEKTRTQDWVRVFTPGGDQIITDGIEQLVLNGANAEDVWPDVTTKLERAYSENIEPYL